MSERSHDPVIARVLHGEVLDVEAAVDDAIDAWHASDSALALSEWLGFTPDEYALFVEKPSFLRAILMARKYDMSVAEVIGSTEHSIALAARGGSQKDVREMRLWLEQTGRM